MKKTVLTYTYILNRHLAVILRAMSPRRQTLLFSATMTHSLEDLKALTKTKPILFDLTRERILPSSLQQQYLFMPAQVKTAYLVGLLQKLVIGARHEEEEDDEDEEGKGSAKASVKSAMVFVGTCQR